MKRILVFGLLVTLSLFINAQETHEFSCPCLMDSYDTEKSVGAWGVGQASNQREAYSYALQDAIESIARRFHVSSQEIGKVANMWCRQVSRNDNNEYVMYVSIQVNKSSLLEIIKNQTINE